MSCLNHWCRFEKPKLEARVAELEQALADRAVAVACMHLRATPVPGSSPPRRHCPDCGITYWSISVRADRA